MSVRAGPSRALVLRGDPGVGKTALLGYLEQHASGCGIARAVGVESEMELAYAGLQQLCAPFLDRLRLRQLLNGSSLGQETSADSAETSKVTRMIVVLHLAQQAADDVWTRAFDTPGAKS